jgi:hypothetical protein
MRRISVVLTLVLVACIWPLTSGVAHSLSTTNAAAGASLQADFNNDGFADLAVGVPFEDVGDKFDAGAVNVLYGSASRLTGTGSQIFSQDTAGVTDVAESEDRFGYALAAGDFNHDGFADLAIGVAGEDVGDVLDAGAVNVLYGSAGKLTGAGSQIFSQDTPRVRGTSETSDGFGHALTTGDFNNDTFDDLAVSVPFEAVGSVLNAGAVNALYGSAGKLTGDGSQRFTQDSAGVRGTTEEGDFFGVALAAGDFNRDGSDDLAVGVPFEDVGAIEEAGAVNVLYGSAGKLTGVGSQRFTEDSDGVVGTTVAGDSFGVALTAGDFNRDGSDDLAVGVPFQEIRGVLSAGAVNVLYGSAGKLTGVGSQRFTQDSDGVGGAPQAGDVFGYALTAGDFDNDTFADLAVGVPSDAVGTVRPAGAVNVLYGSARKLTGVGSQRFSQDSDGVAGVAEAHDNFGNTLTAADFNNDGNDDLAVGVPTESVGDSLSAGAVNVLYGSAGKLTGVGGQIFTQDTPGVGGVAEPSDVFGHTLGASGPQGATASASRASTLDSGPQRTMSQR